MSYPYASFIKTPAQLGASSKGDLATLGKDISALDGYVDVLVSGNSKAQTVSPLGDKYFLDTKTNCSTVTGETVPRFVFINNIPDMKGASGLVPGLMEDLTYMNPASILSALADDSTCRSVEMAVRDTTNRNSMQSQYVTDSDLSDYNACWFPKKINPVTSAKCEGFSNRNRPPYILIGILCVHVTLSILN